MILPAPLIAIRAAFVFMTRLPVGGFPYPREAFSWAPAHFPLVGLVVGTLSAAALWLTQILGPWPSALSAITASIYVTGAFHEDGLADTSDALGGTHSRKKLHEILKDSRIGTYGACALALSLLLRASLIVELQRLSLHRCLLYLIAVHGLSRVAPVVLMAWLPYVAGEGAKGSAVAEGGTWSRAAFALAWGSMILTALALCGTPLLLLGAWTLALTLITLLSARAFFVRAGGYTGDFLGATEQILEIALLAVSVAVSASTFSF